MEGIESLPICSAEELLHHACPGFPSKLLFPVDQNEFNIKLNQRNKLLVCHDMRGNYLNDRYINGAAFENAFQILDWSIVHLFCYFSHNLVSVPPLSWVNCCRTHGTRVLGTFLTEWEAGESVCQELFVSRESCERVATNLTAISITCGVDGWLVNIENKLNAPELVNNVIYFLRILTEKMHAVNRDACVMWYDAVTTEGLLKWQDTVNELNKPFADACDGIFVNYTWKETTPTTTREFLLRKETSAPALDISNVFFGCDVFGRGTAFGGGFNSYKAVQCAFAADASIAIFAPGWVLECCISDDPQRHCYRCIQSKLVSVSAALWTNIGIEMDKFLVSMTSLDSLRQLPICTSFSAATGEYVFISGHPYPHWAEHNSCRSCEKSGCIESCCEVDRSSKKNCYYDLSLQDSRFNTRLLRGWEPTLQHTVGEMEMFGVKISEALSDIIKVDCEMASNAAFIGSSSLRIHAYALHGHPDALAATVRGCFEVTLSSPRAFISFEDDDVQRNLCLSLILFISKISENINLTLHANFSIQNFGAVSHGQVPLTFSIPLKMNCNDVLSVESLLHDCSPGSSVTLERCSVMTAGLVDTAAIIAGKSCDSPSENTALSVDDVSHVWKEFTYNIRLDSIIAIAAKLGVDESALKRRSTTVCVLESLSVLGQLSGPLTPTQPEEIDAYMGACSVFYSDSFFSPGSKLDIEFQKALVENCCIQNGRLICDISWKLNEDRVIGTTQRPIEYYIFKLNPITAADGPLETFAVGGFKELVTTVSLISPDAMRGLFYLQVPAGHTSFTFSPQQFTLIGRTKSTSIRVDIAHETIDMHKRESIFEFLEIFVVQPVDIKHQAATAENCLYIQTEFRCK